MVSHEVKVQGVRLARERPGNPAQRQTNDQATVEGVSLSWVTQSKPALLTMHDEDFPARFLADLAAGGPTPGSTVATLAMSPATPVTLYQPVHRVLHVALLQLTCDTLNHPRLDSTRVESAGVVIRRVQREKGVDLLHCPPWSWMRTVDGQFQWVKQNKITECEDPDPAQRPQLQSGQPALDRLLAAQALATAQAEVYTPAFVAPPAVCDAAGRTFVYAVIPTASSDVSTANPTPPQYDPQTLASNLPTLLKRGRHTAPAPDLPINYQYMSDDYASAHSAANFATFSTTLRMMYTVFGAFHDTPAARDLISTLNKYNVYCLTATGGTPVLSPLAMGTFYQQAAQALIDYDPANGGPVPSLTMPHGWDGFKKRDEDDIVAKVKALLQLRSTQVTAPMGRFQNATRLYRIRVFLRIKSDMPGCPAKLVWSEFSDPFRIAAWHESAGRTRPPVPLPDPFDPAFRSSAKKANCFFAVPAKLMNAMQGTKLSDLTSGNGPASGGGVGLDWICGFNIPLITICAFFVLNIFLILLNLVFFWLPFIKICIPFPTPKPESD